MKRCLALQSIRPVQGGYNHLDPLRVPSLNGFVVSAQSNTQAAPGVKVAVGDRMDQASRANDASQNIATV
jgi:hypothetical protein